MAGGNDVAAIPYDTLKFIRRLKDAGIMGGQVGAITESDAPGAGRMPGQEEGGGITPLYHPSSDARRLKYQKYAAESIISSLPAISMPCGDNVGNIQQNQLHPRCLISFDFLSTVDRSGMGMGDHGHFRAWAARTRWRCSRRV